ncbi:hypothetical protein PYCCODRAFT_1426160 [Trametes coccinea BRFM310]|uniref:Uncharacterized protein n=1 Tax=Trametes coccinea (strain BRFM310) TaxID=1353009 RepID=A0A1Y2IIE1_TRAC3|nr:hypothetical protein PYCCODRAFT_1426160 [Trametes coccinea BRFM310]
MAITSTTSQNAELARLAEYVKASKPDRALLPDECLGEDRIRRFSDFPKVAFWTEHKWHKWFKGAGGSAQVGQPAGLLGKAAQENSRRRRFLEDINGDQLESSYVHRMREFCRSFANTMEQRGFTPSTWRDVDLHVAELFYDAMRKKFPEVQLCEGNWKAEHLMSQVYYDWKRPSRGTKRPSGGTNENRPHTVSLSEAKYLIPPVDMPSSAAPGPSSSKKARVESPAPTPPPMATLDVVRADKGKAVAINHLLMADDLDHTIITPSDVIITPCESRPPEPPVDEPSAGPIASTAATVHARGEDSALPLATTAVLATEPTGTTGRSTSGAHVPTTASQQRKETKATRKPWPPAEDNVQPKSVASSHSHSAALLTSVLAAYLSSICQQRAQGMLTVFQSHRLTNAYESSTIVYDISIF